MKRAIRRRRVCLVCGQRATTYERWYVRPPMVIKSDGSREEYSREKLIGAVRKAVADLPVSADDVELLVERVEDRVFNGGGEVKSHALGQATMLELRGIDQVAYIRFASVHEHFRSVDDFIRAVVSSR